jgi:hypothetical protein
MKPSNPAGSVTSRKRASGDVTVKDQQALELMLRLTCDCAGDPHERTDNAARVKR